MAPLAAQRSLRRELIKIGVALVIVGACLLSFLSFHGSIAGARASPPGRMLSTPPALEAVLVQKHPLLMRNAVCPARPRVVRTRVVKRIKHDRESFLQGFAFHAGTLYESSGLYGRSSMRVVDVKTGEIVRANRLAGEEPRGSLPGVTLRRPARRYFGEGVTYWGGKLYQLTWREGSMLVYDARTLELLEERPDFANQLERREGWGITNDESRMYVTDGSSNVYVVDPDTLRVVETISLASAMLPRAASRRPGHRLLAAARAADAEVARRPRSHAAHTTARSVSSTLPRRSPVASRPAPSSPRALRLLNELEMLPNGLLLFNVWFSDLIGVYDMRSRCMHSWLNATALNQFGRRGGACLNGIAYDDTTGELYLSGKLWPTMYLVELLPAAEA